MRNVIKALIAILLLALLIGITTNMALAAPPAPPMPTATPPPSSGGSGGGGGGGGNSYSAPVFQTYTKLLKSSDGSIIGRLEGKNFNSVMLWAEKNGTIGNASYDLVITGELTQQMPDSTWLDVNFQAPDMAGLPKGMNGGLVLAVVNITGNPANGWGFKTLKYALTISNDTVKNLDTGETYYLVRFDGTNYQVQKIDGAGVGSSPMAFSIAPPSDKGIFTVMEALAPTPTPTPSPTPTPTPVPTPSPTPMPESIGVISVAMSIVTFIMGVVATIGALYLVFMRGKG